MKHCYTVGNGLRSVSRDSYCSNLYINELHRTTGWRTFGYQVTEFLLHPTWIMLWMLLQLGHLSLQETSKLKAVHRTCSWARLSLMAEQQYHEFNGVALMEYCRACSSDKIRTLLIANCVDCNTWKLQMSVVLLTVKPFTPEVSLETFFCVVGGDMHNRCQLKPAPN